MVIATIGLVVVPVHVAGYRERGILRRFRASSFPAATLIGAQALVGLAMATLGSLVLVAAGKLAYDAALPASIVGTVAAFLLGTLAFLAVELLLGSLLPNARAAQAVA